MRKFPPKIILLSIVLVALIVAGIVLAFSLQPGGTECSDDYIAQYGSSDCEAIRNVNDQGE